MIFLTGAPKSFLIRRIAILLILSGCTTVSTNQQIKTRTYIGVIRVVLPDRTGDVSAVHVKGLGIGWDDGPWLGWRSGNWVRADPAKCQLLIIIRSSSEVVNAAEMLKLIGGREICIADFSHSLRP